MMEDQVTYPLTTGVLDIPRLEVDDASRVQEFGARSCPLDGLIDQFEGRAVGLLPSQRHQPGEVIQRDHLVTPALIDIPAVQSSASANIPLALAEVPQAKHQDRGLGPLLEALLQPPGDPVEMCRPSLLLSLRTTSSRVGTRASGLAIPFQSCSHRSRASPTRPVRARNRTRGRLVLEAILLGGEFLQQPFGELGLAEFLRQDGRASAGRRAKLGPIGTRLDQLDGLADLIPGPLNPRLEHQEIQGIGAKHPDLLGQFLGLDQ